LIVPHLVIEEIAVPAAGEWVFRMPCWTVIQVAEGTGYWIHPRQARELAEDTVLLLSHQAQGYFRASQLGGVRLRFFRVDPDKLTGLTNVAEHHFFQRALGEERLAVRVLPPTDPVASGFKSAWSQAKAPTLKSRLQLLLLFLGAFGAEFRPEHGAATRERDARQRLAELLRQMSAAELAELEFSELAARLHCTPRHLSRVFHGLVGVSFREKQTELRLTRARELLTTTRFRVMDVALESGYQSLSLFNLLFKRRFGVSPSKWRERHSEKGSRPQRAKPVALS
jgi:AraC-like DNA-binding protein